MFTASLTSAVSDALFKKAVFQLAEKKVSLWFYCTNQSFKLQLILLKNCLDCKTTTFLQVGCLRVTY